MDRMNFYKCNLIFIGLVRVQQGLRYSFHKRLESFFGHQILWEYLTFWSLLFLFSENNIKRTFFIQDLECGTIESDIFLACLEYTFLLFFRNNTLEGCSIVFQDTIVVQSHHHHLEKKNAKRKRLRTLHLKKKIVVIKSPTTIAVASEQTLEHSVWKLLKMSHLNFWILAFSSNFCPLKIDLSGNTVWPQASGFQKLAKMHHFWHF